jgi:hypothetical protein
MKLKEKSFPLTFSLEEATSFVKSVLEEKNWQEFQLIETKLVFFPYYFFSYHAFFEKEKTVSETLQGKLALNARTSELEEIPFHDKELVQEIKEPKAIPFEEMEFELKEKASLIAQLKVAEKLKLPKENVIIHSIKKVLYPVWIIDFSVGNQHFQFMLSGVNGQILSEIQVPERKQDFWEIASEALNELKSPRNWMKYSASIASDTTNFFVKNTFSGNFLHNLLYNWKYQTFILLIILAIILFWHYFLF